LAFIGAGNMASSLVQGLLSEGANASDLRVADPVPAQREKFAELGVPTYADNNEAVNGADLVVLAVKPQIAQGVVSELAALQPSQVLLSIAAGINLTSLGQWCSLDQPIIRCMPNTPALFGAGMSALFANQHCDPAQRELAETTLAAAGATLWVKQESELDAVTAVSGSGPAYFFLLMEAMVDAGLGLGLDRQTATTLTLQTAYGAALMARDSDASPAVLRQNVTSPGGTTAAALEVMMERGMPATIHAALVAADARAAELAQEFGGEVS
jgi:pyrroline-5-carboxylate reductase